MMKMVLLLFIQFISLQVFSKDLLNVTNWNEFEVQMLEKQDQIETQGISYMISGALATSAGLIGVQNADDIYSRSVFALVQTFGISALGYGAELYTAGTEYQSFYLSVKASSLSSSQKNELLKNFLHQEKLRRDKLRWIQAGTHLLLAALNVNSAQREENKEVKSIFHLLAGVNLVIGLSYVF